MSTESRPPNHIAVAVYLGAMGANHDNQKKGFENKYATHDLLLSLSIVNVEIGLHNVQRDLIEAVEDRAYRIQKRTEKKLKPRDPDWLTKPVELARRHVKYVNKMHGLKKDIEKCERNEKTRTRFTKTRESQTETLARRARSIDRRARTQSRQSRQMCPFPGLYQ